MLGRSLSVGTILLWQHGAIITALLLP